MDRFKTFLFGGPGAVTKLGDAMLAVIRLSYGIFMFYFHGIWKLKNPDGIISASQRLDFPLPTVAGWCAILAETVCAILLGLGLLTRPAALILVFNMGVAAFVAHGGDPWFNMPGEKGGNKESAMLYLLPFLLFAVVGGGRYSIDRYIRKPGLPPLG